MLGDDERYPAAYRDAQKPASLLTEFETATETLATGRRLTLEGVLAGWGCVVARSGPGFSIYVPEADEALLERLETFGFELDMIRSVYDSELEQEGISEEMIVVHLHDVPQREARQTLNALIDDVGTSAD